PGRAAGPGSRIAAYGAVAGVQLRRRLVSMSAQAAPATATLVDLLDGLLDTGVAVNGDVTLAVAGIDLVHLRLKALLASIEAEERVAARAPRERLTWRPPPRRRRQLESVPSRIDADPESVETGLAQLVLVVVDLIREVM